MKACIHAEDARWNGTARGHQCAAHGGPLDRQVPVPQVCSQDSEPLALHRHPCVWLCMHVFHMQLCACDIMGHATGFWLYFLCREGCCTSHHTRCNSPAVRKNRQYSMPLEGCRATHTYMGSRLSRAGEQKVLGTSCPDMQQLNIKGVCMSHSMHSPQQTCGVVCYQGKCRCGVMCTAIKVCRQHTPCVLAAGPHLSLHLRQGLQCSWTHSNCDQGQQRRILP